LNKFIFRASKGGDVIKNFDAGPDASGDVVFEFGSNGTLTELNVPLSKITQDLLAIRAAFDLHKNNQ